MLRWIRLLLQSSPVVFAIALAGCGGGGHGEGDGDADADADADADGDGDGDGDADADADADADGDGDGDCDPPPPRDEQPPAGQIRVTADVLESYVDLLAWVDDAPPVGFHEEVMREGDCRLLAYEPGFCEDCWTGICLRGECIPYPEHLAAGTMYASGILPEEATLDDWGGIYNGYWPRTTLDPGATIRVRATGAEVPAYAIEAPAPDALSVDLPGGDQLDLVDGGDVVVTWDPPDHCGARVLLTLNTPNQAHGLPYDRILQCDAPDTGRLVIPRSLVEAFPEVERRESCVRIDCPYSTLRRYTRATASAGDADLEMLVESNVRFFVVH